MKRLVWCDTSVNDIYWSYCYKLPWKASDDEVALIVLKRPPVTEKIVEEIEVFPHTHCATDVMNLVYPQLCKPCFRLVPNMRFDLDWDQSFEIVLKRSQFCPQVPNFLSCVMVDPQILMGILNLSADDWWRRSLGVRWGRELDGQCQGAARLCQGLNILIVWYDARVILIQKSLTF